MGTEEINTSVFLCLSKHCAVKKALRYERCYEESTSDNNGKRHLHGLPAGGKGKGNGGNQQYAPLQHKQLIVSPSIPVEGGHNHLKLYIFLLNAGKSPKRTEVLSCLLATTPPWAEASCLEIGPDTKENLTLAWA